MTANQEIGQFWPHLKSDSMCRGGKLDKKVVLSLIKDTFIIKQTHHVLSLDNALWGVPNAAIWLVHMCHVCSHYLGERYNVSVKTT